MADVEHNKRMAIAFQELAVNQKKVDEAVDKYMDPGYIQHDPGTPPGIEGVKLRFKQALETNPQAHMDVRRVIAEGDFVLTHCLLTLTPDDRGTTVADIFRVQTGKFIEHWDVMQPVSEKSLHDNAMV